MAFATFGFSRQKEPLLSGSSYCSRYFRMVKKRHTVTFVSDKTDANNNYPHNKGGCINREKDGSKPVGIVRRRHSGRIISQSNCLPYSRLLDSAARQIQFQERLILPAHLRKTHMSLNEFSMIWTLNNPVMADSKRINSKYTLIGSKFKLFQTDNSVQSSQSKSIMHH